MQIQNIQSSFLVRQNSVSVEQLNQVFVTELLETSVLCPL